MPKGIANTCTAGNQYSMYVQCCVSLEQMLRWAETVRTRWEIIVVQLTLSLYVTTP